MKDGDIEDIMFAPCGVNCKVCYKHCESKKNCLGCRDRSDLEKPKHCKLCKMKLCVLKKNLDYCHLCESYPCKIIRSLDKNYKKNYGISLLANSEYLLKMGLADFMSLEKLKYTCF